MYTLYFSASIITTVFNGLCISNYIIFLLAEIRTNLVMLGVCVRALGFLSFKSFHSFFDSILRGDILLFVT